MRTGILLTFIIITCTGIVSSGQEAWTLQDCLDYAYENNLSLKRQGIQSDQYKYALGESRALLLPDLSLQSSGSLNFGRSVDPETNTITFNQNISNYYYLGTGVTLFNGFARLNRIAAARYLYEMGMALEERERDLLSMDIVNAYYNLLMARGVAETASEQLEVTNQQQRRTEVLVNTGKESRTTLLEIKGQVSSDRLLKTQASNNVMLALEELKMLLQLESGQDFDIMKDDQLLNVNSHEPVSADSIFDVAREILPGIRVLELQTIAREKQLSAVRGESSPALGMYAGWRTGYYDAMAGGEDPAPFMEQLRNNTNQYVGVSLNIPIFDNWFHKRNIKRAKLDLDDSNLQLRQEYNTLYKEISRASLELNAAREEYLAARDNLEYSNLVFEAVNKKFITGLANATEYSEAKRQFFSAEVNLLRTQLQYNLKIITIKYYLSGSWDN